LSQTDERPEGEEAAQPTEPAGVAATPASTSAEGEASASPPPTTDGDAAAVSPPRPKPRYPRLVRAFRSKRPVEGRVVGVIKGGYEVRLREARGFCPHSQIDVHREENPERHVGQTYAFRIVQLRRGGEDVVLSRRALLEEQRVEEAKAVRATLVEDAVMQGRVVSVAEFGAFVDLGAGVLGLVHISELSHKRVHAVEDAVKVGDTVAVRILKLKDSGRISLSIRRAYEDPWVGIERRFEPGCTYPGTVKRLTEFGAFVELAPGVEALAPASEFPPSPTAWDADLEVDATRDWCVLSVQPKARRISVAPPGASTVLPAAVVEGAELRGQIQRVERYGVFVWLGPGSVGLMPRVMTGAPEGGDLRRHFRIGDTLEVQVVEVDDRHRRIRLCRKGVPIAVEEEAAPRPARPAPAPEPPATFGTSLAEKLRAALDRGRSGA
jgi:small subunit ribosomal protein S1